MKLAGSMLLVCASVGVSFASPKLEILDRGDAVEVIARDVKAATTEISSVRTRLEVPVIGAPALKSSSTDKTVKVIEMTGRGRKNLSIKLGMERSDVAALTKQAQAIQVGDDLHVIIPRAVAAPGTPVVLPEPTLTPELAAKAAAIAPVPVISDEITAPSPAPVAETKPESAVAAPVTAGAPDAKTDARPEAKTDAKPDAKPEKIAKAPEPSSMRNFPMLLALALAGVGCFAWMKRKKGKSSAREVSTIEVIAQKSLGGKAKIVWLQAGGREMIVSVTPQAVRMLGTWKKSESGTAIAALPEARTVSQQMPVVTDKLKATSPAVSGLLKLRARTNVPEVNEGVATEDADADALWAKEILAATTGARR